MDRTEVEVEQLQAELATVKRNWKYLSESLASARKEIAGRKEHAERLRAELAGMRDLFEAAHTLAGARSDERDALKDRVEELEAKLILRALDAETPGGES
jgi:hypothetical protein